MAARFQLLRRTLSARSLRGHPADTCHESVLAGSCRFKTAGETVVQIFTVPRR